MTQWTWQLWTGVRARAKALIRRMREPRLSGPPNLQSIEAQSLRTTFGFYFLLSPLCIFASVYLYAKVQHVPENSLTLEWILFSVCFHTVRALCGLAVVRQSQFSALQINRWNLVSLLFQVLEGLSAMAFALWIWPLYPIVEQLIQLMAVMLLVAGTSFALAGRWRSIAAFAFPTHLAFVWSASQLEHVYAQPIAVMVLMFLGLHLLNSRGQHVANVQGMELARELEMKNTQLQELAVGRSRLLATVSHDLRQPAHAIGLLCERALIESDPIPLKQSLDDLNELSHSLSASLSTLMDLTRLDAGLVKAKFQPLALSRVLFRLEAEFAESAIKKGLKLSVATSKLWVQSDPVLLHGVLANLVSNGIKYTRIGGVDVEVSEQDQMLVVSVRDTGIGIHFEKVELIFKEFVRLEGSESGTEGLGLGLSIVKRYAELLDLRLSVSSKPHVGSCFSVRFPLISAFSSHAQTQNSASSMLDNDSRLLGLAVLVVDNVDLVLSSMVRTLAGWGCEVYSARTLKEALAVTLGKTLNVVICDFHLGDAEPNGLMLIERLRVLHGRQASQLPALLMTGDVSGPLEAEAGRCQVSVLHKPVRPAVLQYRLLNLLQAEPAVTVDSPALP